MGNSQSPYQGPGMRYGELITWQERKPNQEVLHHHQWRYSPSRALTCLTTSFHWNLFLVFFFHAWTPISRRSLSTSSNHLSLGIPLGRFPPGLSLLWCWVFFPGGPSSIVCLSLSLPQWLGLYIGRRLLYYSKVLRHANIYQACTRFFRSAGCAGFATPAV